MPSMVKARDAEFVSTKKRMVEVVCTRCNKTNSITYQASISKRRSGLCATCKNVEVSQRPDVRQKKSENARQQVLRQGGVPNANLFTSERLKGENNHNWKGGISPLMEKIRKTNELRKWKLSVFKRDQFACVVCKSTKPLEADHIKPFSLFPELRTDINNGRTLCKPCHLKHGAKVRKDRIIRQATGFPVESFLTI
jgi:5-methylcytosine-specific restriction endonuclease McrA